MRLPALEPIKERYYCQFINIINALSKVEVIIRNLILLPAIMMLLYLILPTFNNGLVSFDVVYSQGQIIKQIGKEDGYTL